MATDRLMLLIAALTGLSGLVLAAAGSHVAPGLNEFANYKSWQAASNMHLVHAVTLLFLSVLYARAPAKLIVSAAVFMAVGVVLFSGSIYASITGVLPGITRVAPAGGTLMMLGWLQIAIHALRRPVR